VECGHCYTFAGVFKTEPIYTDTRYDTSPGTTLSIGRGASMATGIAGPHRLRAEGTVSKHFRNFGALLLWCMHGSGGRSMGGELRPGGTGANLYGLQYATRFEAYELNFGYARLNNDTNSAQRADLGKERPGQRQKRVGVRREAYVLMT